MNYSVDWDGPGERDDETKCEKRGYHEFAGKEPDGIWVCVVCGFRRSAEPE